MSTTRMARSRLLGASRSLINSSDDGVIAGVRSSTTATARITQAVATASAANARCVAMGEEAQIYIIPRPKMDNKFRGKKIPEPSRFVLTFVFKKNSEYPPFLPLIAVIHFKTVGVDSCVFYVESFSLRFLFSGTNKVENNTSISTFSDLLFASQKPPEACRGL